MVADLGGVKVLGVGLLYLGGVKEDVVDGAGEEGSLPAMIVTGAWIGRALIKGGAGGGADRTDRKSVV